MSIFMRKLIITVIKMEQTQKLVSLEVENVNEDIISDKPCTVNLVKEIQNSAKEATLKWLKLVTEIDPSEENIMENISAFSKNLNNFYEKLLVDMAMVHQTYTHSIKQLQERLTYLEKELDVEKSLSENIQTENMPLKDTELKLKAQINEYENMLQIRKSEVDEMNKKYAILSERLGVPSKQLPESSKKCFRDNFMQELCELENEVSRREKKILALKREIKEISGKTGVFHDESFFEATNNPLKITDDNMTNIEHFYDELIDLQNILCQEMEILKTDLTILWDLLEISSEERIVFLSSLEKVNLKDSCSKLNSEIRKLEKIKKKNLQKNIEKQLQEINKLLDLCYCGPEVKKSFLVIDNNQFTENVLENLSEHLKTELEKWTTYYNENKDIFETLKNYFTLQNNLQELEQTASDSKTLYKNRGGALLMELRKRKLITSKIQITEEKLLKLSRDYLQTKGEQFLIFDKTIEDYLNKKSEKENCQKYKSIKSSSPKNFNRYLSTAASNGTSLDSHMKKPLLKTPMTSEERKVKKGSPKKQATSLLSRRKRSDDGGSYSYDALGEYSVFEKNVKKRSSSFSEEEAKRISRNPL